MERIWLKNGSIREATIGSLALLKKESATGKS